MEFASGFATAQEAAAAPPVAQTVTIAGRTVNYLKVSGTDGMGGAPVVLLHGFGGDLRNWSLIQGALAAGRDVYAIDLPGHGGSSKNVDDGTLETLAARIWEFLDAVPLQAMHVVGHSMGAAVGAVLALDRPARVKSLTAVCGAGFGGELNLAYLEGFAAAKRRSELKSVVELLFAEPSKVTRELVDDLMGYKRIDGVQAALRALTDRALSSDSLALVEGRLKDIRAPMLVVVGEQDRILISPPAGVHPARAAVIANVGHMPQIEAPEALHGLIEGFIGGLG